jgi:hypothetical protein
MADANRTWMDAERHAVFAHAPAHMRPAFALMAFTGLVGPVGALRQPKTFYIRTAALPPGSKTGEPVY